MERGGCRVGENPGTGLPLSRGTGMVKVRWGYKRSVRPRRRPGWRTGDSRAFAGFVRRPGVQGIASRLVRGIRRGGSFLLAAVVLQGQPAEEARLLGIGRSRRGPGLVRLLRIRVLGAIEVSHAGDGWQARGALLGWRRRRRGVQRLLRLVGRLSMGEGRRDRRVGPRLDIGDGDAALPRNQLRQL